MRQDKLPTPRSFARRGPRVIAARCLAAVAATAAIAACGSTAAPASSGGSGAGSSHVAAKVSLNITVENGPGKTPKHWTLRCDPAGGTHPDPAAACRALLALSKPFAPPPAGTMCPMILASARRAVFTGTFFGTKVSRTIVDGGCDLARWTKLGQVMN
jgi:Subtilisin inhibitor-like